MTRRVAVWAQALLPQRVLGTLIYRIARCTWPAVKNPLIRWFVTRFSVDLSETAQANVESYPTFNAFFTRALKPAARSLQGGEHTVVSPVDGRLTDFGSAEGARLIQAKGLHYSLTELLGETREAAAGLVSGSFATLYLAPHNYHRVHMPLVGTLQRTRYIAGRRFSVNRATVLGIPRLFCRNERVICWFETPAGPMVVVLVGALNVASISTRWLGEIPSGQPRIWKESGLPQRRYGRGDEIARFNLGSTVILMLPPGRLQWQDSLRTGQPIAMGQALGEIRFGEGTA